MYSSLKQPDSQTFMLAVEKQGRKCVSAVEKQGRKCVSAVEKQGRKLEASK